jgi:hypothetical protein
MPSYVSLFKFTEAFKEISKSNAFYTVVCLCIISVENCQIMMPTDNVSTLRLNINFYSKNEVDVENTATLLVLI